MEVSERFEFFNCHFLGTGAFFVLFFFACFSFLFVFACVVFLFFGDGAKCKYWLGQAGIPTKSEWADFAVQALCGYLSGKRAHPRLVRERSSKVV